MTIIKEIPFDLNNKQRQFRFQEKEKKICNNVVFPPFVCVCVCVGGYLGFSELLFEYQSFPGGLEKYHECFFRKIGGKKRTRK